MKAESITINYKDKKYVLNREEADDRYFNIGFKNERWSVRISIQMDNRLRIIIDKAVKKSEMDYQTQFCWDCYCRIHYYENSDKHYLFVEYVHDPATCKRISKTTRYLTIHPIADEIFNQLKDELLALNERQNHESNL